MHSFIKSIRGIGVCALIGLGLASLAKADTAGFGVLGDSYADEYQFYPPDRASARNFVELLATDQHVNFGAFSKVSRGDPRNQGYAYDWALSGAQSNDLATQTAGLAQQVAAGQVNTSFMFIGGNDFLDALQAPNAAALLPAVPETLLTNVLTSIGTLLGASSHSNVVVANLFDITQLPIAQQALYFGLVTPAELKAVSQLITGYNQALASALANNPRVAIVDFNGVSQQILSAPTFSVDGVAIDRTTPSDNYTSLFLADGLHIGTVGQGLLANAFVSAADTNFNAGILPLSQAQIIESARSVPAAVPLPRTWEIGLVGFLIVGGLGSRLSRRVLR